jgi:hypothetical protein
MNIQQFITIAAIPAAAIATGFWARDQARLSAARRTQLIRRGIVGVVVGIILARGIWYVGPTNRESPAMIFTYLFSWFIGGGTILMGLALWIGASRGRPADQ